MTAEDVEASLHEAAVSATGLTDFGANDYRVGLRKVLETIDTGLPRPPALKDALRGILVPFLISRLHSEQGWTENPECLDIPVRDPLVIVGVPRSGTTALHKLLAVDDAFQGLQSWLLRTPMVRPPLEAWPTLPAYRGAVAAHDALLAALPELKILHHVAPHEVDECIALMAQSFVSNFFAILLRSPSYDEWFRAQDHVPVFQRFADNLRLIGAREKGKRWLLKNPSHLLTPEALCAVFPDARIVHIHRDPLKTLPSMCSLFSGIRKHLEGPLYDPREIARREVPLWKTALEHMESFTRADPKRVLDVTEDELITDPLALAHRIYAFADMTLSAPVETRMQNWGADNPRNKHGMHRYDAETFGLGAESLREAFAAYRAQKGFTA